MARKAKTKGSGRRRPSKANQSSEKLIEKLRKYIRTEGSGFLDDANITSLGIGYKISKGKRTKQLCLQFTVKSKPEEEGATLEELDTTPIPPSLEVAGESIPTDVIEREFKPSFQLVSTEQTNLRKQRVDPVVPGVSVSHPSGTAGTVGLIVYDRRTGEACMLSNWHVLHREPEGKIGDPVVQPGPFDDNRTDQNHAGRLVRSHLGPAGDCAIARIEERKFAEDILELGTHPKRIGRAELDDVVVKSGRTTGVTRGVVRRVDVVSRINYSVGERDIGGFEIGPEEGAGQDFEISMGGDSGSTWLVAGEKDGSASDVLVGLHFAGEGRGNPDEHALACNAHSVFKKLDIALEPPPARDREPAAGGGYNSRFLKQEVPTPGLSASQKRDAAKLNGSVLIPYTHFSLCLSKQRRLARFVAWNIDGNRIVRVSRRGIKFKLDPRIAEEFQNGNELYSNNTLDRGHIARRIDLAWGSMTEAKRANRESFFFTNIAPQHEAFNQSSRAGLWGRLENAVFEDVDVEDLRVSVMGGPIFRGNDPIHRGVQIPREFWKLIAFRDTADGEFKARAFVLTQRDLLTDIEALELDEFRLFQVSLDKLTDETKLDFSALEPFDTFRPECEVEAEALEETGKPRVREVRGAEGLFA